MLETALKEYFATEALRSDERSELLIRIVRSSEKRLWRTAFCEAQALLFLRSNEIPFQENADSLIAELTRSNEAGKKRIKCNWLVCSEQGGIYLHETIASKENRTYKGMRSRFMVLNKLNGVFSFGPGHILNEVVSARLKFLLENYRLLDRAKWLAELRSVMDYSFEALVRER